MLLRRKSATINASQTANKGGKMQFIEIVEFLERELKTNKDEYEDSSTQVNEIVLF